MVLLLPSAPSGVSNPVVKPRGLSNSETVACLAQGMPRFLCPGELLAAPSGNPERLDLGSSGKQKIFRRRHLREVALRPVDLT